MNMMFIFFMGCCLSSFAYCFAYDWVHSDISFIRRSHCDHCGETLKWFELIPLISIITSSFRCRYCRGSVSMSYLTTELFGGLLTLIVANLFNLHSLVFVCCFSLVCLLMIFCDWHGLMVPDLLQGALLLLCLHDLHVRSNFSMSQFVFSLIVFLILISLNFIKHNSIGGADIKTLTILALLTPIEQFPVLLFTSSSLAILYIVGTRPPNDYKSQPLPFIPFIFIGYFVASGLAYI